MESEVTERRRDSSIKKILSNQPLEKQEYVGKGLEISFLNELFFFVEINQKVQNSTVGASKVHSGNDPNSLERANSAGGRESRIVIRNSLCVRLN